jgi:hypothetical protein
VLSSSAIRSSALVAIVAPKMLATSIAQDAAPTSHNRGLGVMVHPRLKMTMGPATRYPMGIYSIRVQIWSKTHTHGYVNGAKPSLIGYVGTGTV